MAELDFDPYDSPYRTGGARAPRVMQLAGAAVSLSLLLGAGVWGYNLAMRDVAGIPVIRALEGPLRMASDNPGGAVAEHQGLSVNAIAAAGTALPIPESLRLAPRPADLAPEDVAGLQPLEGEETLAASTVAPAVAPLVLPDDMAPLPKEMTTLPEPMEQLPATQEDAVALALAEALGEVPAADPAADVVRPRPRPGTLAAAPADPVATPAVEMDPATIAAGTPLVQLGAFEEADLARAEWTRLADRFGPLLADKALVVQPAQSGGRTFYRLRAHGFAAEEDARRFCTALLAENATCIPVAQR